MSSGPNWRRRLEVLLGVPATDGNELTVLVNGDEIFPAMLDAIDHATRSIELLTFVYWSGDIARRFADALSERARAGVHVRVLLDAVGARDLDEELVEQMETAGCQLRWFRAVGDEAISTRLEHRTHRKILVCDETVGFTGGVGIADEWTGDARTEDEWRDTHVRVVGPAVDGLRGAFLDNWVETDPELVLPTDDFPAQPTSGSSTVQVIRGAGGPGPSALATLLQSLITGAQRRVRVSTAYFSPNDPQRDALVAAAARGVDVEIIVPGPHADKRFMRIASEAVFEELLEAGVRVFMYQPSMLHTKIMIVDDEVAAVGSANFDSRSSGRDDEVNLVVFDETVVRELDQQFDLDLRRSKRVDPEAWAERGTFQRLAESAIERVADFL